MAQGRIFFQKFNAATNLSALPAAPTTSAASLAPPATATIFSHAASYFLLQPTDAVPLAAPGSGRVHSKLFTSPIFPIHDADLEIANIRGYLAVAKRSLQEDKAEPKPQDYLKARKLDIDNAFRGQALDPELRRILIDHLGDLLQIAQLANRPGTRLHWSRDGVDVVQRGATRRFSLPPQAEEAYRIFRRSDL